MKTKQLDWSYPTSENANQLGFPNGCYTVSVSKDGKPAEAVKGFPDQSGAITFARSLPIPFGALWRRYEAA